MVKMDEVEVKPFFPEDFTRAKEIQSSMKKVTKRELRNLADSLGIKYTDEEIGFAKKLITAYHKTYSEKR